MDFSACARTTSSTAPAALAIACASARLPRCPAASTASGASASSRRWTAATFPVPPDAPAHRVEWAVLVIALWRQSYKPEERPAQNAERERAFNEVVNAFSFLPEGPVTSNADIFHVAGGVVRLPYSASDVDHPESFEIGFDGPTHWLKFDVEYRYIEERPDDDKQPGFLQRVAHTVAEWPIVGHSIRSGRRVVAGFSGEESILRSKDDHTVRCGWIYEPAKDLAGFQPTIKISAESDDGDVGLTTDFWDQALVGLRRLGS